MFKVPLSFFPQISLNKHIRIHPDVKSTDCPTLLSAELYSVFLHMKTEYKIKWEINYLDDKAFKFGNQF